MVGADGFEPPRPMETGLQPAAFGLSATHPRTLLCSGDWARTSDIRINSPTLYPLSYTGAKQNSKTTGARGQIRTDAEHTLVGFADLCLRPLGYACIICTANYEFWSTWRDSNSQGHSRWVCSPVPSTARPHVHRYYALLRWLGSNQRNPLGSLGLTVRAVTISGHSGTMRSMKLGTQGRI